MHKGCIMKTAEVAHLWFHPSCLVAIADGEDEVAASDFDAPDPLGN